MKEFKNSNEEQRQKLVEEAKKKLEKRIGGKAK